MLSDNKFLVDEFEIEVWLYLDKDLPEERMSFWKEQIDKNEDIGKIYQEITATLSSYDELGKDAISEVRYNSMIENTIMIDNSSTLVKIKMWMKELNFDGTNITKLAFGGTLVIAAFLIIFLSNKPHPIKEVSADLLDWDAPGLTSKMNETAYEFAYIKDKELENYILESIENDPWKKNYYNIKSSMQKIENEIKQESL